MSIDIGIHYVRPCMLFLPRLNGNGTHGTIDVSGRMCAQIAVF